MDRLEAFSLLLLAKSIHCTVFVILSKEICKGNANMKVVWLYFSFFFLFFFFQKMRGTIIIYTSVYLQYTLICQTP